MKRMISLLAAATGIAALHSNDALAVYYGGRVVTTLTITATTPVPSEDQIACETDVYVETDTLGTYTEHVYGFATLTSSPGVYTCTLTIPWQWNLSTPTTDIISITASAGFVPNGTTTITGLTRSTSHTFSVTTDLSKNPTIITENLYARL